jgi:ADP-ribosylglycohydrolase
MALGIVEVLQGHGRIDQDELVRVFARRYWADVNRGYGPNIHAIFEAIKRGVPWRTAAIAPTAGQGASHRTSDKLRLDLLEPATLPRLHLAVPAWLARLTSWLKPALATMPDPGRGSLGNGGAMRVAPVGGYFADDIPVVVREARASAEVTHAHPDGMAGAVAVAVAAAWAWKCHAGLLTHTPAGLLDFVQGHTPDGPTRARLVRARALPPDTTADQAARDLGNGSPITSAETVPFTAWCAARHLSNYEEAVWTAASVGGDIDTICAIVGGVVALGSGRQSIPPEWLASREKLAQCLPAG